MHPKTRSVSSVKVHAIAAGLLLAFGSSVHAAPSSGPSKTAQGIFVKMVTPAELAIEQNIQYRFDTGVAATYFTNAWDGAAPGEPKCTGGSAAACTDNKPASAPQAPLPLASGVGPVVFANRCVWKDGGMLSGGSYTQTVSVVVGKLNYTYTYTYNVTPSTGPVAPLTAWVYDRTLGDASAADLEINAQIAGQSVVVSKQFPSPGKFSFSLANPDLTSRVTNLVYTVTDQNGVAVSMPVSSTTSYPTDLLFESYNGGKNGAVELLWPVPAMMSHILNNDAAPNNNNGGADGSAMAVDTLQTATFMLPAGEYTINLTGTVKGNAASADVDFNIQNKTKITLVGSSCGQ